MYTKFNAHAREDKFLKEFIERYKLDITKFAMEFGANDGVIGSNIRHFLKNGWSGIWVEPSREGFAKLQVKSQGLDVELHNVAISNKEEIVQFTYHPWHTGSGGINPHLYKVKTKAQLSQTKQYPVQCKRIASIVKNHTIGIMSIDTEGHDYIIAKDLLESEIYPEIVIIEGDNAEARRLQKKLFVDTGKYVRILGISFNNIFLRKDKWISKLPDAPSYLNLDSTKWIYERVGYDSRPMSFSGLHTITTGKAKHEMTYECIGNVLNIYGAADKTTCMLHKVSDTIYEGQWLICEKMPIKLTRIK